jgi:hypothetical protein
LLLLASQTTAKKRGEEKSARGPSLYFQQHQKKIKAIIIDLACLCFGNSRIQLTAAKQNETEAIDLSSSKSNISNKTIT